MGHKPPIPEKLSTEGKDFLSHCLESEPKYRSTASVLLDHPFVKVWTHTHTHSPCNSAKIALAGMFHVVAFVILGNTQIPETVLDINFISAIYKICFG